MTLSLLAVGRTARIIHGDAAEVLRRLPDASVDSVVTDPPSGIKFLGVAWDGDKGGRDRWVAWLASIMAECLRVLKPGGHSLTWALPRVSHWTGYAIEDGGFEIRDRVTHLFGDGMSKSRYVLKPSAEDWWLARRPINGTVEANIAAHGTGGLNIEACRLEGGKDVPASASRKRTGDDERYRFRANREGTSGMDPTVGRWPANATLDESAARLLDEQSGHLKAGWSPTNRKTGIGYKSTSQNTLDGSAPWVKHDSGGASRFYYVAKADELDKTEGGAVANDHETVKSTALMRWLVRLVTPPGGTVLDPFAGSGTTGVACAHEGMSFIGIEQERKHHLTATRRLKRWYSAVSKEIE